jgi:hypothetical protein
MPQLSTQEQALVDCLRRRAAELPAAAVSAAEMLNSYAAKLEAGGSASSDLIEFEAFATPSSPMCAKRLPNIWSAVSLRTALPVPAVVAAGTTTLLPSPAKAVESAPRAPHGAWWRRRRT